MLRLVREHAEPARVDNYAELEAKSPTPSETAACAPASASRSWLPGASGERSSRPTRSGYPRTPELVSPSSRSSSRRRSRTRRHAKRSHGSPTSRRHCAASRRSSRKTPRRRIFAAVSAEVDRVFGLDPPTFDVAGVVRFEPGPELVVVGVSKSVEQSRLGSRFPPDDLFAPTHVLRTGRSARIGEDDLASVGGEVADVPPTPRLSIASRQSDRRRRPSLGSDLGQREERASARHGGAARTVHGARRDGDRERGVARDAGTARRRASRAAARGDARCQGRPPGEVFAKVAEETGRLLGGVECTLLRNERDGAATNVGTWGEKISAVFPLGTRFFPDGDGVAATVLRTGHPHRIDDYSAVADPSRGVRAIEGSSRRSAVRSWCAAQSGVPSSSGTTGAEPFPPETELRLAHSPSSSRRRRERRGPRGDRTARRRAGCAAACRDARRSRCFTRRGLRCRRDGGRHAARHGHHGRRQV